MKSRTGTKLYAVRDSSGKFKDIQSYKRAHATDLRQKSAAESGVKSEEFEKKLLRAKKSTVKFARDSMQEAAAAVKVARRSFGEAVVALRRATNRAAKRVYEATSTTRPAKGAKRRGTRAGHGLTL
jgi:hypothetical protein